MSTTVNNNGVTYQIYGTPRSGSGYLSERQVADSLNRSLSICNTANNLSSISSSSNSTVKIFIDPSDGDLSNLDRAYAGTGVYIMPGDTEVSIIIKSSEFMGDWAYKVLGENDSYALFQMDGTMVHELGHIDLIRTEGVPLYGPDNPKFHEVEERVIAEYENPFYQSMGIPQRDGHGGYPVSGLTTGDKLYVYGNGAGDPITLPDKAYERAATPCKTRDGAPDPIKGPENNPSPLVLDLNGDGVQLINLVASNVFFDIDSALADGMAENTAWVSASDGLLAIDLNQNGFIDNASELFGDQTGYANGFQALASLDSNSDGFITNEDANFERLLVWVDANTNGYTDVGELHTLDSLLITSINIAYTDVNYNINGNNILQESTFTINGNTRDIVDAYFAYDNINTKYNDVFIIDYSTFSLPSVRGYGNMADLHIAMSLDNDLEDGESLIALVTNFNEKDIEEIFNSDSTVIDDVRQILYRWAKVDGLSGNERGDNIDSRELTFMEAYSGRGFLQLGSYQNPYYWAGQELKQNFHDILNKYYASLVVLSSGGALFEGSWSYNLGNNSFEGVTGINLGLLNDLQAEATLSADPEVFWQNVIRMIEYSVGVGSLPTGDQTALNAAIYASNNSLSLSGILDSLEWLTPPITNINGTSGNDTLNGGAGIDDISAGYGDDIITGGGGADLIDAGYGSDTITGGAGADLIRGNSGNDTYIYNLGDGVDTYREQSNDAGLDTNDVISLGAGIDSGDITFTRAANSTDLIIDIDTGVQTGQIVIEDQFNWAAGGGLIETIVFSDTTTISLATMNFTLHGTSASETLRGVQRGGGNVDTIYGNDGNDKIYGYDGNDTLYGGDGNDHIEGGDDSDTIYGDAGDDYIEGGAGADALYDGSGDDYVNGGTGNDTFYYGGGHDTYIGGQTETIILPSGFTSGNTVYYKIGNTMKIVLDQNNTITIPNYASAGFTLSLMVGHLFCLHR